ncbi:MAG: ABC transporter substrate-binding protein [Acetobacteraceae bacterium]|nr:ABC transporter substrate-binding protein [Acetobacteraceae bacterium]
MSDRMMRRREFITLLGGAAAAWPLVARAQQTDRVRRIGALMGGAENAEGRAWVAGFVQGLSALGWTAGRNMELDVRWAAGETQAMNAAAAELVKLDPDVILARGSRAIIAARQETASTPIVFVGGADPVGLGFVASMARPGGRVTGFTIYEETGVGKLLEMLREASPTVDRALLLHHLDNPTGPGYRAAFETAASLLRVKPSTVPVKNEEEVARAIERFGQEPNGGLIAAPDQFLTSHADLITRLATRYALPAAYPYREFVRSGALIVYTADIVDLFRRAAAYVDRVLRGEKPGELPIQAPVKFELIVNLKTAKTLGLTIPLTLLARADEVSE